MIFRFVPLARGHIARMRIRKTIDSDDVKAAIAVNVGEQGSVTAASSTQKVDDEEVREEDGQELPDREGTYDELREEAAKKKAEADEEGDQDG